MKKLIIFYLIIPLCILFFSIIFLSFIPQQNLAFAQACEVSADCRPSPGSNYCCGNNVCNDYTYQFCNLYSDPPNQCAPDFTIPNYTHIDNCACGCSSGSCNSCAVCSVGQTESYTTLSCTSNPSSCGGYSGRCDQYATVHKRTCKDDRSGWNDWYVDNEYSQCPTDSSIDCGNCTVPATCGDGSCNNGETCSSCRTDCGVCPPGAKYKCSGSSCIRDDAGGTTSSPNCGNLCSSPPSGCPNATLSVSPNPVNINSPVTFSATSSYAYAHTNVSTGGGTQGGDDFSVVPSYTWKWVYDPSNTPPLRWGNSSSTAGTYNATFSGDRPGGGSSCTFSTSYTVNAPPAPTNLQVTGVPACSVAPYPVTFSWTNTNSVLWLDVAENSAFTVGFANKNVSNQTSTSSTGFTLNPGTTYYWRLWNGSSHTAGPSFSAPSCVSPTPTISTPACIFNGNSGSGINISWASSNPAVTYVDISTDNFTTPALSNKAVTNTSTTGSGFSGGLTFNPNTPYYVRTWNGYQYSNTPNPSFSIPFCVPDIPTGLTGSCPNPGNSTTLSWNAPPGAEYYQLRVNNTADGWDGTCSSPKGDFCSNNELTASKTFTSTPGDSYSWWVHACNSSGCSGASINTNFTCIPPPCPAGLGACGDYLPAPNTIGVCSGGNWVPNHGLAGVPGEELGYDAWCKKNANPTRGFCYQCNTATTPWIQITGDVHTNSRINAPGGPR